MLKSRREAQHPFIVDSEKEKRGKKVAGSDTDTEDHSSEERRKGKAPGDGQESRQLDKTTLRKRSVCPEVAG